MKRLLIVYPHWPPSNLAGVHRGRLIANFSQEFGWDVTVLTVHEEHYEERLDPDLKKLVAGHISVIKTGAFPVIKLFGKRLIGDIGIRSFFHLKRRMCRELRTGQYDFVWIPIPSWYSSLLGRKAKKSFHVPFGIDYIDPWVYQLTADEPRGSRAWWAQKVAQLLEPIAIRDAALISGVSAAYFKPAIDRNFISIPEPTQVEMPYGFDPNDHRQTPSDPQIPWDGDSRRYILYAGAFLPHSEIFVRVLFQGLQNIKNAGQWPPDLCFRFVGTGHRPGASISDLAKEYGVDEIVLEHPERLPFLDIQHLLRQSFGTAVIGSTEAHYTASKTFQCILAGKPVFAIFHEDSSAARFMQDAQAANFLVTWNEQQSTEFETEVHEKILAFANHRLEVWHPDLRSLDQYSSKESARALFTAIDSIPSL